LPHRGFATSGDRPIQGPNLTYWKSNPYLTSKFAGESDTQHPQWVIVDLKAEKPLSALRIQWASPYAVTTKWNIGVVQTRSISTEDRKVNGESFPQAS